MAPYNGTQQWHHVHCTLQWHPGATSNPSSPSPLLEVRTPIAIAIWGNTTKKDKGASCLLLSVSRLGARLCFSIVSCFVCVCIFFWSKHSVTTNSPVCWCGSPPFSHAFSFLFNVFYICRCFLFVCFLVALFHFAFSLLLSHSFWIQLEYNDTVEKNSHDKC